MTSDTNQDGRTFLAVKFLQLFFSQLFHFNLFPVIALENSLLMQQFSPVLSISLDKYIAILYVMLPKTDAFADIPVKISWYIFEFLSEN